MTTTTADTEPDQEVSFEVSEPEDGIRADKIVVSRLVVAGRPTPRAEVQRWMADGLVTMDGAAIGRKDKLRVGAKVVVKEGTPLLSEAAPEPDVLFSVVYVDEHLIVVDKPAGLVVHPAKGHRTGTLVNGLLARGDFDHAGADPRDGAGHLRPGIVHRIDKDTSGLLVVAKTATCREALKELFAQHDIERAYLAIAVGRTRKATCSTTHSRHPKSRRKFTSLREEGKRALTHVQPLESLTGATLVRCTLETGRTHQIRVHLAEQCKTPVLADALYGHRPQDAEVARISLELGRQALHAAVLGFTHPVTGETMRWQSALPQDMQRALNQLRG